MRFSSSCVCLLAILCAISASIDARAQPHSPVFTLNLGLIETLDREAGSSKFALYPEVEARAAILRSTAAGLSLSGGVYAGGWRDVNAATQCRDCITYSYTSFLLGARVGVSLDQFPLPLLFRGGLSRHFVFGDYVSGATLRGADANDYRDAYNALEAGVRLQIPVIGRLHLGGDAGFHVPLPISSGKNRRARLQYTLATTYALK